VAFTSNVCKLNGASRGFSAKDELV